MTAISVTPGTTVRVAPRDAASLSLGEAAAHAAVEFSPWGGEPVQATADASGSVAVPAIQPPALVRVAWEEGGIACAATLEVVQAHYCELGRILAHGPEGDTPADHGAAEPEAWEARARAEEVIERNARRRFVPTLVRQQAQADGSATLLDWPDASGIEADAGAVADEPAPKVYPVGDAACVVSGRMGGQTALTYVAGMASTPAAIAAACEDLAASYLVPSRIPDRATGESTDAGMLHYTLAGVDGATGIPDVDAAIEQFGRKRPDVL